MKGVKLGETILLLPTKGYTAHSTALEALSYGEVWAGRNVPGLSRPCRHRRVGIATRGRESKRCIGAMLGAGNMRIPKFDEWSETTETTETGETAQNRGSNCNRQGLARTYAHSWLPERPMRRL